MKTISWISAALAATSLFLINGCCPQPECKNLDTSQFQQCIFDFNPVENSNKDHICFGDSIAVGGWCSSTCGFIEELERLTDTEIANFGIGGHTADKEVGGWKHKKRGNFEPFARVDLSVEKNPGARRVYMHIGGNDLQYFLRQNPAEAPVPADDCFISDALAVKMVEITENVRLIAERYRYFHEIPEVVIGSVHPIEETAVHGLSCKEMFQACSGQGCHLCLNELLEYFSFVLEDMTEAMGGAEEGIYFADHFHEFPEAPGPCSVCCDCLHLNCQGHIMMAQIWYDATTE